MKKKIMAFEAIVQKVEKIKQDGKRVVLCNGIFHSLHVGHIRYLKQAREFGDIVIVSIMSDRYIYNGEKPKIDERMRAEAIAFLDWVDVIVINPYRDVNELIEKLQPNVHAKGFESCVNPLETATKSDQEDLDLYEKIGVKLVTVHDNELDSTKHINRYLANMPEYIQQYMHVFKQRFPMSDTLEALEKMQDLRVLVIGDTILDEYQYCTAIGKSSKDPTLVLQYNSHDLFAGGVLAIANHIAGFAKEVNMLTILGEDDSQENFIRSKLRDNVFPEFLYKPNSVTTVKRRFVDGYSTNKMMEVYVMDDSYLSESSDKKFCKQIQEKMREYDLIVVSDFGHGAISMDLKRLLSEEATYLAVNAQSNAGNRGFNNITKYTKAKFISIAEHEIRMEMRDLTSEIRPMMVNLAEKLNFDKITVSRGRKGSMILNSKSEFAQVPSFAQHVVDRVGAGDALFSISSLAAFQNHPCELIGFLGNVAGSLAVQIMGNQTHIDKKKTVECIRNLYDE